MSSGRAGQMLLRWLAVERGVEASRVTRTQEGQNRPERHVHGTAPCGQQRG